MRLKLTGVFPPTLQATRPLGRSGAHHVDVREGPAAKAARMAVDLRDRPADELVPQYHQDLAPGTRAPDADGLPAAVEAEGARWLHGLARPRGEDG